jgi:hypothetical protein
MRKRDEEGNRSHFRSIHRHRGKRGRWCVLCGGQIDAASAPALQVAFARCVVALLSCFPSISPEAGTSAWPAILSSGSERVQPLVVWSYYAACRPLRSPYVSIIFVCAIDAEHSSNARYGPSRSTAFLRSSSISGP